MGTCSTKDKDGNIGCVSAKDFKFEKVIGSGGFGNVWKAMGKHDKKTYAIKVLNKVKILHNKSADAVMEERKLLSKLDNP